MPDSEVQINFDAPATLRKWPSLNNAELVPGDVMLAQKIALETDELGALAIARNFTMRI